MNIVIVKYNAGNIHSVQNALHRIGTQAIVTDDVELIINADKVILPGVGAAGTAMSYLKDKNLDQVIASLHQPVLGICLGMQLMCAFSEEDNTTCIGIFDQPVLRFSGIEKVPQVGWNNVCNLRGALFKDINEQEYMYFVHSYYAATTDLTIATTEYGARYSAAVQQNNFYGVQFHPEKSGAAGQRLLQNFVEL
jgi:glutamine amidotransferase